MDHRSPRLGSPTGFAAALAMLMLSAIIVFSEQFQAFASTFGDQSLSRPALGLSVPFFLALVWFWRSQRDAAPCRRPALIDDAEIKRQEHALLLAEHVLANAAEATVITDARGVILLVNPAYSRITGYTADEICGRKPRLLNAEGQDRAFYTAMWRTLRQQGSWSGGLWSRRKNGETFQEWLKIVAVYDAQGSVTRYVAISSDISQLKRDEALIEQMRNFDALTGLPNWEFLLLQLQQAMAAASQGGKQLAVLFLDIDCFKRINDALGHGFGDYIISAIAERLVRCAGEGNTVARRGGDEFCILLRQIGGAQAAAAAGERLRAAVAEPLSIFDQEYTLTASIGISLFPADGDDASTLLSRAGAATHQAKREGRNNIQFFSDKLSSSMLDRLLIDKGLRRAIKCDEFVLHYQPQVSMASGQIVGVEALIRWHHPEMGMIPPARFIPLAEETGMIVSIGEWVLQEACRQARAWHDAGFPELHMAVNLSPVQFKAANLAQRIEEILAESGLPAEFLELEITEGVLMADPARAAAVLNRLKQAGIRFSVDDFGTGYSSLGYLKRFPLDHLKIDRSFVGDCYNDHHDAAIVDAVIGLSRSLGLKVVAEGVENLRQLAFLHRHGCDYVQGYLFSPPLSALQMTELLAETESYLSDLTGETT